MFEDIARIQLIGVAVPSKNYSRVEWALAGSDAVGDEMDEPILPRVSLLVRAGGCPTSLQGGARLREMMLDERYLLRSLVQGRKLWGRRRWIAHQKHRCWWHPGPRTIEQFERASRFDRDVIDPIVPR